LWLLHKAGFIGGCPGLRLPPMPSMLSLKRPADDQQMQVVTQKVRGTRRGDHVVKLVVHNPKTGETIEVFEFHNLFNVMLGRPLETDFVKAPTHAKIVLEADSSNVDNELAGMAGVQMGYRKRALSEKIKGSKNETYTIKTINENGAMAKGWKFLEGLGLKKQTWEVCTLPHMCKERLTLLEAHKADEAEFLVELNKSTCTACAPHKCPADWTKANNWGKMILPYILGV
jgi:hypothetical protein